MRSAARVTPAPASTTSAMILADDLTGAADGAAPFAALGLTTRVTFTSGGRQHPLAQVMACALDTRNLPTDAAVHRLTGAMNLIPQPAPDILLCKIDSAGRGHIGESVLAALDGGGCEWALVTPAFPAQGRRVQGGVLRVAPPDSRDQEGCTHIPLKALFPDVAQQVLANVSIANLDGFAHGISAALDGGRRILLCDAETQDDLANLVCAARQIRRGRVLWCGSAALARAVADSYFTPRSRAPQAFHAGRICVVFAGTPHPVTQSQMKALTASGETLQLDPASIPRNIPAEIRCVTARVRCGETSAAQIRDLWGLVQDSGGASGIVLTGGDTALMVLQALDPRSILLQGEIADGIPWGILAGGLADGTRVITKSGGFGTRDALTDAVSFLEQRV